VKNSYRQISSLGQDSEYNHQYQRTHAIRDESRKHGL